MKTKLALAACVILLTTAGFDCINSPLIVALNLDPIAGCIPVNIGNGSFNGTSGAISIKGVIPSDYQDNLIALRISDIRVRASGSYPAGNVSGTGYFKFDNGTEYTLLSFNGPYSSFATGVSMLNPGVLITYSPTGLKALIDGISNVNNLPGTITVRGQGNGPAVTQSFKVCLDIVMQADADVN